MRVVPYDDPHLAAEEPMESAMRLRSRPDRTYVETNMWTGEEEDALFPETARWAQPAPWLQWVYAAAGMALLALVGLVIVLPFRSPFRERLGPYVYLHVLLIAAGILWFFLRVLPPPFKATERMRRHFLRLLPRANPRGLGLDEHSLTGTRLAPPDTLEITMTPEWCAGSYERRLRDAQNLWRLWAYVYTPYEGYEKVLVRLLDSRRREVGGSKPQQGWLIWVEKDRGSP